MMEIIFTFSQDCSGELSDFFRNRREKRQFIAISARRKKNAVMALHPA
ncbi:MAG: hypothetical protein ACLQVG_04115 [Terriglobia bacterium]